MHAFVTALMLTTAALFPNVGNAQVLQRRNPAPVVTAASADWQVIGDPIVVAGLVYYATREYRLFDGDVMTQIDVVDRVPVYADVTLEPYSLAFVPVGGTRMRVYERRREGAIAGTTGSRTPSFPVDVATAGPGPVPREEQPVATRGGIVPVPTDRATVAPPLSRPLRVVIETLPPRASRATANGIWIEYDGARWYSAGPAVSPSDRMTPAGEYRGFPVYRDPSGDRNQIWVQVVEGGPVAPYKKR